MTQSLSRKQLMVGFGTLIVAFMAALPLFAATTSALMPTGDGTYNAWVTSNGAGTRYTQIDESACNGVTDYNRTTVTGSRDSYSVSLASVPNGATITNIALTPCASRHTTGGGSATLNVFYRFNGTDSADAGAYALPSGTTPANLVTTNFGSLSLVKDDSSTLEVGAVYSSGNRGVRLSRLATVITYTPLAPTVTTNEPTIISTSTTLINLNGTVSSNGAQSLGWFRYSTTDPGTCSDSFGTRAPSTGGTTISASGSNVAYSRNVTGLATSTTYYYCAIASNSTGTSIGSVVSFTTPSI